MQLIAYFTGSLPPTKCQDILNCMVSVCYTVHSYNLIESPIETRPSRLHTRSKILSEISKIANNKNLSNFNVENWWSGSSELVSIDPHYQLRAVWSKSITK